MENTYKENLVKKLRERADYYFAESSKAAAAGNKKLSDELFKAGMKAQLEYVDAINM